MTGVVLLPFNNRYRAFFRYLMPNTNLPQLMKNEHEQKMTLSRQKHEQIKMKNEETASNTERKVRNKLRAVDQRKEAIRQRNEERNEMLHMRRIRARMRSRASLEGDPLMLNHDPEEEEEEILYERSPRR